jgi:hypothetical protein
VYFQGRTIPILLLAALTLLPACTSTIRTTDPARTATEQFLLSQAASLAVSQLTVEGLRGRRVFVDDQYSASESKFVLGELRNRLFLGGVQLVPERKLAQVILEVRSGGVGIDRADYLLGLPSLVLSAGEDGDNTSTSTPIATPELALLKNINQVGVASVAFIAYWADTGEVVASSGPFIGRTTRDDWWVFGFGPRTVGNIPTTDPTAE